MDGADMSLLKTDVATILGDLSAREAYVLRMRFGLDGSSPSTLATVGQQLNLTRERIRQIQLAAIKKLRGRSITHEALYSDRAVAGGKAPATITDDWDDGDGDEDGQYGGLGGLGLPSPVLIDLVKQALEPREDEMLDSEGRVVTGARRRLMRQMAHAERAAAAAEAAALNGKDDAPAAGAGKSANKKKKKKRGFVMKRPYARRPRKRVNGEEAVAGDPAGAQATPPPVQRTAAWQPSLQAA